MKKFVMRIFFKKKTTLRLSGCAGELARIVFGLCFFPLLRNIKIHCCFINVYFKGYNLISATESTTIIITLIN